MESRLEWLNEDEGIIAFLDDEKEWMSFRFFVTGEAEAEIALQDAVWWKEYQKTSSMENEIDSKMKWCLEESVRLLCNEGFEESVFVAQNMSDFAKILDSTCIARYVYSEYMMKHRIETGAVEGSYENEATKINMMEVADGYICKNSDKTFCCRLLPYSEERPGERCFYLYEVEVAESERNKGIATACLKALFRKLAEKSPISIYLQVGSYNEPAVHLYSKLGFAISEELCYYCVDEPGE